MEKAEGYHVPVMLAETLAGLAIKPDGTYLDATAGGGGHSAAILDKLNESGRLLAIDRDDQALNVISERFVDESRITFHKLNFGDIGFDELVRSWMPIDGVLFDFGLSSHQIDDAGRGFSFMQAGPLDMRMDQSQTLTAAEVVNDYDERSLVRLLKEFGEEPRAKRVAAELITRRPISTTDALSGAIEAIADPRERVKTLARVYQAIRIEVNGELAAINRALEAVYGLLGIGGRLVVLSYHSLEDRRAKRFLRKMAGEGGDRFSVMPWDTEQQVKMRAMPRKAVTATQEEISRNSRARSARLRIAEKVG
jgi:16S rRNA (cytosine1402-N4)-methyltransferase